MSREYRCLECRARDRARSRLNRRVFLRAGGMSVLAWGTVPGFLQRAVAAGVGEKASGKTIVCLFLRGAVDGLSLLVPHGDPDYYRARPRIAIAAPGRGRGGAIDLDGGFGLHPALMELESWYRSGNLAIVQAVGSPNPSRSHFEAQDAMERGVEGPGGPTDGWLNRLLAVPGQATASTGAHQAVALTRHMPRSLLGPAPALAVGDLERFLGPAAAAGTGALTATGAERARPRPALEDGFRLLYSDSGHDVVIDAGAAAIRARSLLRAVRPLALEPSHAAQYPNSDLGRQLRQVAQLIKADIGLQVAFTEAGGWDTHANQGAAEGQLAGRLRDLSRAVAAFVRDLDAHMNEVVLVTLSEFGRTVEENGSAGTDHGHGTVSLVLGGGVRGGRVLGRWPGLAPEVRFEGRDLAVTTDYRDLLTELAAAHLQPPALERLFPGHPPAPSRYPGLFAGSAA